MKKILQKIFNKSGYTLVGHYGDSLPILKLATKIRKETDMRITIDEAIQIYHLVKATGKLQGSIAEVGTYTGASSKIICEAKGERKAYFFDTFEGLPDISSKDVNYHQGQYKSLLPAFRDYLKAYPNIEIIEGLCPESAKDINDGFSFVHLDVDIYSSTMDNLKFFYPKMEAGGIILTHDYSEKAGVYEAFNEFFKDKPEAIIELSCSQAMIVKK